MDTGTTQTPGPPHSAPPPRFHSIGDGMDIETRRCCDGSQHVFVHACVPAPRSTASWLRAGKHRISYGVLSVSLAVMLSKEGIANRAIAR